MEKQKEEPIKRCGMLGKRHSDSTKNKISSTQRMRHAIYRNALKESELRHLTLRQPHDNKRSKEDEWMEKREKVVSDVLSLCDHLYQMYEVQGNIYKDKDEDMKHLETDNTIDDINEDKLIKESLRKTITEFINTECNKDEKNKQK